MQLVEEGKIDLQADVNTYLKDFKIPATFPQPITIEIHDLQTVFERIANEVLNSEDDIGLGGELC